MTNNRESLIWFILRHCQKIKKMMCFLYSVPKLLVSTVFIITVHIITGSKMTTWANCVPSVPCCEFTHNTRNRVAPVSEQDHLLKPGSLLFSCWKSSHVANPRWSPLWFREALTQHLNWWRWTLRNMWLRDSKMPVEEAETIFFTSLFFFLATPRNAGCCTFKPKVCLSWPGILWLLHEVRCDLNVQTSQTQHETLPFQEKQEKAERCGCSDVNNGCALVFPAAVYFWGWPRLIKQVCAPFLLGNDASGESADCRSDTRC